MATTRTTAEQGKTVTLKINFKKNGNLQDPYDPGTVTLLDTLGATITTGLVPVKEADGVWYVEYAISATAEIGEWTDRWTDVIYDSGLSAVNIDLNFYVQAADWGGTTPSVCDVYEFIYEQDGDPRIGIEGTAKIVSAPYSYGDAYYSSNYEGTAVTNSSGKIVFSLVYGATVRIEIPDIKLEKIFVVPSSPQAQLQDIAEVS